MFRFFKKKAKSEPVEPQSKQGTVNDGSTAKEGQNSDTEIARVQRRGLELRNVSMQRIKTVKGYKEPIADHMGMVPLIHLSTDDYCYSVLKVGLDFPIVDDYASEAAKIADGYLPINEGFYVHGAFVVQMDLNRREVVIDPDFEASMQIHLRGNDVIDKLDSFRVKGKPAGYYRIKPENVNKIVSAIEKMQRTRSN